MVKKTFRYARVLSVLLSLFLAPYPAYAESGNFTEDDIRDFVMRTSSVMDGTAESEDGVDVQSYLTTHLSPEGLFKSEMTYNIPGYPAQKNTMALDRTQFIESVLDGRKSLQGYKADVSIQKIGITDGGQRANVRIRSRESGTMTMQTAEGQEETLPVEGISLCDQVLIFSEDGEIQILSADCRSEMTFAPLF